MTLVRYNPLNDFVSGTFGDVIENFIKEGNRGKSFTPAIDVFKTENNIELHVYAPGVDKNNFNIDLNDEILTISGARTISDDLKKNATQIESHYGEFKRSFKLSGEINTEEIEAKYENGVLILNLPLTPKKEAKVIKVS